MTDQLFFHPVSEIFPLMAGAEYAALVDDIREHGLREPIWLHDGMIVDGRNRYRACVELGTDPAFRAWRGDGSLVAFVVSANDHKLQLMNTSQRAMVAARVFEELNRSRFEAARVRRRKIRRLRAATPDPGPQEDCFVCGKFRPLTHAHHILPVAEYADSIYSPERQRTVWLCPNHHELLHRWRKTFAWQQDLWDLLSKPEQAKLAELVLMEQLEAVELARGPHVIR